MLIRYPILARWRSYFALCLLLLCGETAPAQTSPGGSDLGSMRIEELARNLHGLTGSPQERRASLDFMIGNVLFALVHEMGHALISEMGLPVLGREEDAADSYAVVTMLKLGSNFSHRVLVEATRGWFFSDARATKEGTPIAYYDEHGLDRQRAYHIICLMVGSDPDRFEQLANEVKMPSDRQGTCQGDYSNASWSWDMVLKSHLRAADQPKMKISVFYGEVTGKLEPIAHAFRAIQFLESVADDAAERFVWRIPFTLEMRSCGQPEAHWDLGNRKVILCYELAEDFLRLYRDMAMVRKSR